MARPTRRPGAARAPRRPGRLLRPLALVLLLAGCAAGVVAPEGTPVAEPEPYAAALIAATVPPGPRQATFQWTLREQGSRVTGRGVARYVAPERLRLDLFGPRGESYLSAGLVGEQLHLPAAAQQVELPPPALLWAALGVVAPPADAELLAANTLDGTALLRYGLGEGELLEYRIGGIETAPRLLRVERTGASGVLERVELDYGDAALRQARYRNLAEFRELELVMETIKDAPAFPETIWNPVG